MAPQYVIDRVIGHTDGTVSSQYGQGVSLGAAYEVIKSLNFGVDLPAMLGASSAHGSSTLQHPTIGPHND